jgi:3-hydroxybutyryl-CoA dehydrogenase
MKFSKVGVIGAGNIGTGVVTDLVMHDIHAVVVDVSAEALEKAQAAVLKNVRYAPLLSKTLPRVSKQDAVSRMTLTQRLQDAADCDFIIENVTENWDIKKQVYSSLDEIARPDVCFGANTSCLSITRIAGITKRPDKVVGMHLMNPVHLKPTVEVIKAFHTADSSLEAVNALFAQLNKESIVVDDLPGFVSNRISHLFMNEAAWVLQDNVATPDKIDAIFKKCFGHKMGPLETADLIGLDTVVHSLDVLYESYQDPKFRVCPLLRKMVHAGQLGRKAGKGFFVYTDGEV